MRRVNKYSKSLFYNRVRTNYSKFFKINKKIFSFFKSKWIFKKKKNFFKRKLKKHFL